MTETDLLRLLDDVRSGALAPRKAMERLKLLPFEDLDFAKVDHHRALRQGFAEVVFGKGKTAAQVAESVDSVRQAKPSTTKSDAICTTRSGVPIDHLSLSSK